MNSSSAKKCENNLTINRLRKPDEWKSNKRKRARNEGKMYETCGGKMVCEKSFKIISSCCHQKCYEKIDTRCQENNYNQFWSLGEYDKQNIFLSHSLKVRQPKPAKRRNADSKLRSTWSYWIITEQDYIQVCLVFLCNLFQVGKKRIQIIQKKMLNYEVLNDQRGKSHSRFIKLTDEVKELILVHCNSLPHRPAIHSHESTSKKYFEDPLLGHANMYQLFCDYYISVTGKTEVPIGDTTYISFLVKHSGFSCQQPKQKTIK